MYTLKDQYCFFERLRFYQRLGCKIFLSIEDWECHTIKNPSSETIVMVTNQQYARGFRARLYNDLAVYCDSYNKFVLGNGHSVRIIADPRPEQIMGLEPKAILLV